MTGTTGNIRKVWIVLLGLIFLAGPLNQALLAQSEIKCSRADRERVESLLHGYNPEKNAKPGDHLLAFGMEFLGSPYVAHTLEGPEERLVVNLDSVDCTTYVEYSLALYRTWVSGGRDFEAFATELEHIRYRDGQMRNYDSRLHYFSEWIHQQNAQGVASDMGKEFGGVQQEGTVNFMSTHSDAYRSLKNDPAMVDRIRQVETELNLRERWYIPNGQIPKVEGLFRNGDIVGITTDINGLDIQHTGMLVYRECAWHLLHASSLDMKVVISDSSLTSFLEHSSRATGIMILRILPIN